MKINIQQIKNELGAKLNFRFNVSAAEFFNENERSWIIDPITVAGNIINDGLVIKVTGDIVFNASFECDRCLESYTNNIVIGFDEEFREGEHAEADDVNTFHGDVISLSELVRETIIMSKPLKTVCIEDCKGLCHKCGINLNISSCTCEKEDVDPRLAALQQLLDRK